VPHRRDSRDPVGAASGYTRVDLNVLTGFGGEDRIIDILLDNYAARLPDGRDFALRNRILLLKTSFGTGIDISLGALPFGNTHQSRYFFRFRPWPGPSDLLGRGPRRYEAVCFASRRCKGRRGSRDPEPGPIRLALYRGATSTARRSEARPRNTEDDVAPAEDLGH
jgi:hypothetical protein